MLENVDVVIEGNVVKKISAKATAPSGATVIDGTGHTLMPGIVEAHGHLSLAAVTVSGVLTNLSSYAAIISVVQAETALMNGVTTVRDMGGEVFSLKAAIDGGVVPGPRIYPSGPPTS